MRAFFFSLFIYAYSPLSQAIELPPLSPVQIENQRKLTKQYESHPRRSTVIDNPGFIEAFSKTHKIKPLTNEEHAALWKKSYEPKPGGVRVDIFFDHYQLELDEIARAGEKLSRKYHGRIEFYYYLVTNTGITESDYRTVEALEKLESVGATLDYKAEFAKSLKVKTFPKAVLRYENRLWQAELDKTLPVSQQLIQHVHKKRRK